MGRWPLEVRSAHSIGVEQGSAGDGEGGAEQAGAVMFVCKGRAVRAKGQRVCGEGEERPDAGAACEAWEDGRGRDAAPAGRDGRGDGGMQHE
eukprot:16610-Chlamydomonas_euryale.AAC.12